MNATGRSRSRHCSRRWFAAPRRRRSVGQSVRPRRTMSEPKPPASRPASSRGPDTPGSSSELLPVVYDELRRLARSRISREPDGLTLQPTALVHEAYLRLTGDGKERHWDGRGHFFAAAAIAMRRILVERARHYKRIKHGGTQRRVELDADAPALHV